MKFNWKQIVLLIFMSATTLIILPTVAIISGYCFGFTKTNDMRDLIKGKQTAMPTQILDKKGRLIGELVGEQKREIIYFHELPIEIITALMAREDPNYFYHSGFTLKSTLRAIAFIGRRGGGSTITQQYAGEKFIGPLPGGKMDMVIAKIKELWFAFNLERDLSKQEIIQLYFNLVYFGHGAYGIEAASQFYFGHTARELTLAESAVIIPTISNPTFYSPIKHPDHSVKAQMRVLKNMVEEGYISQAIIQPASKLFWKNFDKTRSPQETYRDLSLAKNKAPYFTDYVTKELSNVLTGTADIYRDGYIIETTLDLDLQQKAETAVGMGLNMAEKVLNQTKKGRNNSSAAKYIPIVDLLCMANNIKGLDNYQARREKRIVNEYINKRSPTISLISLLTANSQLQELSQKTNTLKNRAESQNEVQTSMITIENNTGRILTMIGGRDYDVEYAAKLFNRATDSEISPGSCIKPLYYSAGISARLITPATIFNDSPAIFYLKGAEPFIPRNYADRWSGPVRVRYALKKSMNVPSVKILDTVGFDLAIKRIAALTGMQKYENDQSYFPRKYPIALGTIKTTPLNMARAYATFANNGLSKKPHGIMAIKDRNGNPLGEYGDLGITLEQKMSEEVEKYRIMKPEEAAIMVSMLESTVSGGGTLWRLNNQYKSFDGMPMAGKTGTTQNWEDAWTIGFSPYMTTAIWFGFDKGNQTLGSSLYGAKLAGTPWAYFMSNAHKNLPIKEFYIPDNNLETPTICKKSGKLATGFCKSIITELVLTGTGPTKWCTECNPKAIEAENIKIEKKLHEIYILEQPASVGGNSPLGELDIDSEIKSYVANNEEDFDYLSNEIEDNASNSNMDSDNILDDGDIDMDFLN